MSNILVIKHSSLGDVVLATGPFQAIREHHKHDRITLLTTRAYGDMLRESHLFDDIWIDSKPKLYNPFSFFILMQKIKQGYFSRIYDLQTSGRTEWYFKLLPSPKPEWVGTAEGASHQHNTPERTTLHTIERQKQQLEVAGIHYLPKPNIEWLTSDVSRFTLPERTALIVPGGSAHRPEKRWPAVHYSQLCAWLLQQGITPVLLGTNAESAVLSAIETACPTVRNLQSKTSFADAATLARSALCAVGNDTGPMHLIAATGCRCLVLFSQFSNPALCAPRGDNVTVMQQAILADLPTQTVISQVEKFLRSPA